MHKSPASRQRHTEVRRFPTDGVAKLRGSAKVLLTAVSIAAAVLCLTVTTPRRIAAQDKAPDSTAQSQPQNQPNSSGAQAFDLSDEMVRDVLTDLQSGIETHNLTRVMDVFDGDNMKDYAQFHDQMVAFFRLHDSVKFRYQLLQASADKDQGFAIADIDMDADPSDILPTEQRRSTQMRFQMKRGPKGWKVTGLRPMDFFKQ